jgi:hypothetical protein
MNEESTLAELMMFKNYTSVVKYRGEEHEGTGYNDHHHDIIGRIAQKHNLSDDDVNDAISTRKMLLGRKNRSGKTHWINEDAQFTAWFDDKGKIHRVRRTATHSSTARKILKLSPPSDQAEYKYKDSPVHAAKLKGWTRVHIARDEQGSMGIIDAYKNEKYKDVHAAVHAKIRKHVAKYGGRNDVHSSLDEESLAKVYGWYDKEGKFHRVHKDQWHAHIARKHFPNSSDPHGEAMKAGWMKVYGERDTKNKNYHPTAIAHHKKEFASDHAETIEKLKNHYKKYSKKKAVEVFAESTLYESQGLVVAAKRSDGSVKYGKPGQIHSSLYEPEAQQGFALPGGKFMTRKEALDWLETNEPKVHHQIVHNWKDSELESVAYRNSRKKMNEAKQEAETVCDYCEKPYKAPVQQSKTTGYYLTCPNCDSTDPGHYRGVPDRPWLQHVKNIIRKA